MFKIINFGVQYDSFTSLLTLLTMLCICTVAALILLDTVVAMFQSQIVNKFSNAILIYKTLAKIPARIVAMKQGNIMFVLRDTFMDYFTLLW